VLINPVYDSFTQTNAPASFFTGIQTAINMLDAKFIANITVNIAVDWGNQHSPYLTPSTNQNFSFGGLAGASTTISYTNLRNDLLATTFIDFNASSLPNAASVNGHNTFIISSAQQRLFGLTDTNTIDGAVEFGTQFTGNSLISVALHELTHALGRDNATSLDIFRFSSAGNRVFTGGATSVPAYFSLDNGATDLADFGQTSDPGDFLNSSGRTPNDPFNEFVGTLGRLDGMDVEIMRALGFQTVHGVTKNDFNADGQSDLLWFNGGTRVFTVWDSHSDNSFADTANSIVGSLSSGWKPVGIGDFTGLGKSDLIFQNGSTFTEWQSLVSAANGFKANVFVGSVGPGWFLAGVGDFNFDGRDDLIWQNGGTFTEWQSTGNSFTANVFVGSVGAGWSLAGVGDFTGSGKADLIWQNGGTFTEWQSTGNSFTQNVFVGSVGAGWQLAGVGDFTGNARSDLLWFNAGSGTFTIWDSTGSGFTANNFVANLGAGWSVAAVGDFNGDGFDDILFRNTSGTFTEWESNGTGFIPNVVVNSTVGTAWTLQYSPTGASGASGGPAGSMGQANAGNSGGPTGSPPSTPGFDLSPPPGVPPQFAAAWPSLVSTAEQSLGGVAGQTFIRQLFSSAS
jgi:hypothetical protein